jgi:hypothetical protein
LRARLDAKGRQEQTSARSLALPRLGVRTTARGFSMDETADFSWVTGDGAIVSGGEQQLWAAYLAGELGDRQPVWHPSWGDWLTLGDALSRQLLELGPASTERRPMRFDELPDAPDPDSTVEDLTLPRGVPAIAPPPRVLEPVGWAAPPAIVAVRPVRPSQTPPGVSHTVRPAASSRSGGAAAVAGIAFALTGVVIALAFVAVTLAKSPVAVRARSFPVLAVAARGPGAPAAAPAPRACRLHGAPVTIADRVQLGTPIDVAARGGDQLGVGAVTTTKSGVGLDLALGPLSVAGRTPVADPVHVGGVVPLGDRFRSDQFARTVDADPPFGLGMTPLGFCRIDERGVPTVLWRGEASQMISRPSVARAPAGGWVVAFRRGAETGTIRMGWLSAAGNVASELQTFSERSGLAEAPSLATNRESVVIAFAAKQPEDAPWSLELGQAPLGKLVDSTEQVSSPGGADRRAPSLAPLARDRFVLAWAEGDRRTGRSVQVAVLDERLHLGKPLVVAPSDGAIGTTALWSDGARTVVLFSERIGRQTERLRAAALDCR